MSEIERAAIAWWKMKSPVACSEAEHLENPTVNTVGPAEARLANECAKLRKRFKEDKWKTRRSGT